MCMVKGPTNIALAVARSLISRSAILNRVVPLAGVAVSRLGLARAAQLSFRASEVLFRV